MTGLAELLGRIERTYDALPRRRGVRVEAVGPFEVFVREGEGWPLYARPRLGAVDFSTADVEAVLARQRDLAVPEAIEWVFEVTPGLLAAIPVRLPVRRAPLMVLDPTQLPSISDSDEAVILLDPSEPGHVHLAALGTAVATVGFAHPGTDAGVAGPAERDAAVRPSPPGAALTMPDNQAEAVLVDPRDGVVARGGYQAALGVAEIAGVATLPSARRRGHAAALTARLARHALTHGNDLVFLSAADEAVARTYVRVGFRHIGTAGIAPA